MVYIADTGILHILLGTGDREALELEPLYVVCHGSGEAWLLVDGIIVLPAMSELDAMNDFCHQYIANFYGMAGLWRAVVQEKCSI